MATSPPNLATLSLGSTHGCNKPGCQAFTSPRSYRLSRTNSITQVRSSKGGNDKLDYISQPKDLLAPSRAPKPRMFVPMGVATMCNSKHHWSICWNKRSTFSEEKQKKPEQLVLLEMRVKETGYQRPGPSKLSQVMSAEET